jgi:hypothetical protein
MIIVINYADHNFIKQQKYNTKTAYKYGADIVIEYSPDDLDQEFKRKYWHILSEKRGAGYWLWKPYIILKTFEKCNDGDYLFYVDSGAYFVNKISYLIEEMNRKNDYIMAFELPLIEKQWTKRDAFILMNCDSDYYAESNQILAGYILARKCHASVKFFEEYLNYCTDYRILTDLPNEMGKDNYENFIEHRHDQSVFSLLCKKYNIKPHRDPSQFGIYPIMYYSPGRLYNPKKYEDKYPQILVSCRRETSYYFRVKELLRRKVPIIFNIYYSLKSRTIK